MTRKTNTQLAAEAKLKHDKYTRKAKEAVVANDRTWLILTKASRALRLAHHQSQPQWLPADIEAFESALVSLEAAAARIAGIE